MSFKTLQQRYEEKVNDLYRGATSKFENGRPSRGANDDPLIVRKVGDGYFGGISRALGRFLPVSSAFQDVKRLTLFTFSVRGAIFLGKQALLQTGNTFESTRLLNPAFTVANAVPFLHIRRFLTPGALTSGLIGKTDTSTPNVRGMGQLQQATYDKLSGDATSFGRISFTRASKNIGWLNPIRFDMNDKWESSRPELSPLYRSNTLHNVQGPFKYGGVSKANKYGLTFPGYKTYLKFSYDKPNWKWDTDVVTIKGSDAPLVQSLIQQPANTLFSQPRTEVLSEAASGSSIAQKNYSQSGSFVDKKEKYKINYANFFNTNPPKFIKNTYKDSSNQPIPADQAANVNTRFPYDSFNNNFDDYVIIEIATGTSGPAIRFRAYLTDLQQSVSPQYKEYQYVGRTEKFISYTGAQREVSFKLGVLAEHPSELKEVWKRINYLTGLVFPYGVNRGIYQPNIAEITIGKVFYKQPVYITSLSTNFSQITESWDVDAQVPMGAQIDMKCILIEKRQQLANSPFYGYTEQTFTEEYAGRPGGDNRAPSRAPGVPVTSAPSGPTSAPVSTNGTGGFRSGLTAEQRRLAFQQAMEESRRITAEEDIVRAAQIASRAGAGG